MSDDPMLPNEDYEEVEPKNRRRVLWPLLFVALILCLGGAAVAAAGGDLLDIGSPAEEGTQEALTGEPTAAEADTATPVDTATSTATDTSTPVDTATNTPTSTATSTNTPTRTPTSTATHTPTATDTATPTATDTPVTLGLCGGACTDSSQCGVVEGVQLACFAGVCWDANICGGVTDQPPPPASNCMCVWSTPCMSRVCPPVLICTDPSGNRCTP